jgi:hypothetical protein
MNGRLVRSFFTRQKVDGPLEGSISVSDLPSGMYLARWNTDLDVTSQRFVVE